MSAGSTFMSNSSARASATSRLDGYSPETMVKARPTASSWRAGWTVGIDQVVDVEQALLDGLVVHGDGVEAGVALDGDVEDGCSGSSRSTPRTGVRGRHPHERNRLALALLLVWARAERKHASDSVALPAEVVAFVGGQLGLRPNALAGSPVTGRLARPFRLSRTGTLTATSRGRRPRSLKKGRDHGSQSAPAGFRAGSPLSRRQSRLCPARSGGGVVKGGAGQPARASRRHRDLD
jgi:hypothetical protein